MVGLGSSNRLLSSSVVTKRHCRRPKDSRLKLKVRSFMHQPGGTVKMNGFADAVTVELSQ